MPGERAGQVTETHGTGDGKENRIVLFQVERDHAGYKNYLMNWG